MRDPRPPLDRALSFMPIAPLLAPSHAPRQLGAAPVRSFLFALRGLLLFGALGCVGASAAPSVSTTPPAAAIASAHPAATKAGERMLAAGGNAFDAAIAVAAALAVVEPYSSGLGGGGFWLLHLGRENRAVFVDARERAPLAASRDMYLDDTGAPAPEQALNGPLAAAIPGVPAALDHLATHYARLPLRQSLAPAIRLARDGFPIDAHYRRLAGWRLEVLRASPAAAKQFLLAGEAPPGAHVLRQPELARTLERIAARGRDGFYAGELAERLVAGVRAAGGIWTHEDLRAYRVVERAPIVFRFRGWTVTSAPPPSAGGIGLAQMLGMLAARDLDSRAFSGATTKSTRTHLIVETMRRAYRDRAAFLGDPDQVEIPIKRLMHPYYLAGLARDISPTRASSSLAPSLAPSLPSSAAATRNNTPADKVREGRDTSHFSILDREGNRVAATLSINYPFGAGFVPPGTGVLLNDEMDDFAAQPGEANAYGLVGGEANAIAPGKRMLSSMTPTFAESDQGPRQGVAILGTPGGSRIVTMVLNTLLALTEGGTPATWVAAARFHHQYLPDVIQHEPDAFDAKEIAALKAMGHRLEMVDPGLFGNMQLIYWDRTAARVRAASDPRGQGASAVLPSP